MDWSDSPDQATFRGQVKSFIKDRLPEPYRKAAEGGEEDGEGKGL